jgi:hypothetical protein
MSAKKTAWTAPGSIEPATDNATEARKGTAAANPVLSLAPEPAPGTRRGAGGPNGSGAGQAGADHRSPAEIEAEIEQTRDRLAGTLDELTERLSPRAALRRADSAVREAFVNRDGAVRKDRAGMAAGALLAVVGGCVALLVVRHRD